MVHMENLLKDMTVLAETSEHELGCLVIVRNTDVNAARDAIEQARSIWLNHEDSDECLEDLRDQIRYILEGRGIEFVIPYYEEV